MKKIFSVFIYCYILTFSLVSCVSNTIRSENGSLDPSNDPSNPSNPANPFDPSDPLYPFVPPGGGSSTTCLDGTENGLCSSYKPMYCNEGHLESRASVCSCPTGYVVSGETCISSNPRDFEADKDYSSLVEKQIKAGTFSTAGLIVDYHPRMWLRSKDKNPFWEWDSVDEQGSFAWRIAHEPGSNLDPDKYEFLDKEDFANDAELYEFYYMPYISDDSDVFNSTGNSTFGRRYLWTLITAEAEARRELWNLPSDSPKTSGVDYDPLEHTSDELLANARDKLLGNLIEAPNYEWPYFQVLQGSVAYDWLVSRKFSNGTPVLSLEQRTTIQKRLIVYAEYLRAKTSGDIHFFDPSEISNYFYVMVGLALYEPNPSNSIISASDNAVALQYLNDFDTVWVKKILPAYNEQGGTGEWHGGLGSGVDFIDSYYSGEQSSVASQNIAQLLFSHYTATGQPIESSIYSTGFVKYAPEFQAYMIYPNQSYLPWGVNISDSRMAWISPMYTSSRRRFSSDSEQKWLGELAGYVRSYMSPSYYVNAGSYDSFDQLMWEEKFPNPRSPKELGCGTRHFAKLGWVAMRSDFQSTNDLAALFVSQRYHWSPIDLYAQNSFHLMRKGWLIENNQNTIFLGDSEYQRTIADSYPTVNGTTTYAPNSTWDVGPGIQSFESNIVYDYIKADATRAYHSTNLSQFVRHFVFLKPDIFVIFDNVITKNGVKPKWHVDPASAPQDRGNHLWLVDNGSGSVWVKSLLPASSAVSFDASKIDVVPSSSTSQTFFLHALQVSDSGISEAQISLDESTVTDNGSYFSAFIGGHEFRFGKDNSFSLLH